MPPPESPKLYLNEHLSPRLAGQLRKHGFDVLSSQEAGLLSADDSSQLAFAISQQRAAVSFNFRDFVALHEEYMVSGKTHWGIVLSTEEPIGVLLHRLLRLLNSVPAKNLKNDIRWLNEFR
jgi:predicted nuclease of predicted toxin-antitoxin system